MSFNYRIAVICFLFLFSTSAYSEKTNDEIRRNHLCNQIKENNKNGLFSVWISWGAQKKFGAQEKKMQDSFLEVYEDIFQDFIGLCSDSNINDINRNIRRAFKSCEVNCIAKNPSDKNFDASNCAALCVNKFNRIQSFVQGFNEAVQIQYKLTERNQGDSCNQRKTASDSSESSTTLGTLPTSNNDIESGRRSPSYNGSTESSSSTTVPTSTYGDESEPGS